MRSLFHPDAVIMAPERKHPTPVPIAIEVTEEESGRRLDKLLAERIDTLSRAQLQALLRAGHVTGPGARTIGDGARRVKPGETYAVAVPEPAPAEPAPENIALAVVYEDDDLIVIDKPAGIVVHPAAGHASGTLVNALIAHCGDSLSGIGGVRRPGIVHRLDKDTSGLLVVAKNDAAHQGLSEQFASHGADGRLHRAYLALVWGTPLRPRGVIDAPLTRSPVNRKKIAIAKDEIVGRRAVTHYDVEETIGAGTPGEVCVLKLHLETGRTHQIRVHLAHLGHPVVGDPVYGSGFKAKANTLSEPAAAALAALGRQALHAAELGFEHPRTGEELFFSSPLPADIAGLAAALRAGHSRKSRAIGESKR
jgi:23S rRNA pseudouridine1911/1915/1917 synthase